MPGPRYRRDTWFDRHPRIALAIGIAGLGALIVWEIARIAAARRTVHEGWAVGLATGIAASPAMGTALIVTYRRIQRAARRRGGLLHVLTLLIGVSPALAFVFTAPQPGPESEVPYVVTTGVAVAGMAYTATFFALYLALGIRAIPRVMRGAAPASATTDRDLLTALVGPCEKGWDVSWTGNRRSPRRLSAATLTEVTDQAAEVAAQHYVRRPAKAMDADFQIALFPHYYTKGPIFDISGSPGAFTATDKSSGCELHAATLEQLVQAAESASDLQAGNYMFHWTRPVTALSPDQPMPA